MAFDQATSVIVIPFILEIHIGNPYHGCILIYIYIIYIILYIYHIYHIYIYVDPVNGLITIPHQKNRGPMTIQGIQFAHWGTQLIRNILTSGITAGFPVTVGKIIGMGESCWLSWGKNSWIPGELGEYCRVI